MASRSRAAILKLLFDGADHEFYLRDIERRTGLIIRAVQQEIPHLLKLDLIESRKDGNRRYLRANRKHPLYPEICQIVMKTTGWVSKLTRALTRPDVKFAFVFGSIARGDEKAESDIDLMVIGEIGLRLLSSLTGPISRKANRVVNPHVYSASEFERKMNTKDHFVTAVLESKKFFLIGSDDEIEKMGH